jgi:protein O-mannosyl-transferase
MSRRVQKKAEVSRSGAPRDVVQRFTLLFAIGGFVLAGIIGWILYAPAMNGMFLFDDSTLPFERDHRELPLPEWMSGVRPGLMASYWLNFNLWGDAPLSYHAVNVLIHLFNTGLIFLVLWRLFTWANWETNRIRWAAGIGALIFLIHPIETEAVSYVAGRSESLAMMLVLLAYNVHIWRRREAISWIESGIVLVLFGLALSVKENAICLAGLLLLTDIFWPTPFSKAGLLKNWRLYVLMLPGAVLGAVQVFRLLATAPSAGFGLKTFTWYQYLFTESRAIFSYIRLSVLPTGLSLDHDYAASYTIWEHGAIFWIALLVGLTVMAVRFSRKYPLACFGWLLFLVLLAPTSSIVPVNDAFVERRMYLPLAGLILIGCEISRRVRVPRRVAWTLGGAALVLLAAACYARNEQWRHPEDVLGAAAMESRLNIRPYLNVTQVLVHENRCTEAVPYLNQAEKFFRNEPRVQIAWAWALECMGKPEEALQRLQTVAKTQSYSRLYEWIGLIYGEMHKLPEAGAALHKAVALDPQSESAHEALALWYETTKDYAGAEGEHRKSVGLDPFDQAAQLGVIRAHAMRQ